MKKNLFILAIAVFTLCVTACGPSRDERVMQIEDVEDSIFENPIALDTATADHITALYVTFADKYPDDTLAPIYLMKAAETQANVLHTGRAISLYDRIIDSYPLFSDIPMCIFLKGSAYEQNGQYDEARDTYRLFVERYPDHYMADPVNQMLPYVGMSPEEMFDSIMAQTSDTLLKGK